MGLCSATPEDKIPSEQKNKNEDRMTEWVQESFPNPIRYQDYPCYQKDAHEEKLEPPSSLMKLFPDRLMKSRRLRQARIQKSFSVVEIQKDIKKKEN